jgi:ornithine carbamoyltransferase
MEMIGVKTTTESLHTKRLTPKHVLSSHDLSSFEITKIIELAIEMKAERKSLNKSIVSKEGLLLCMIFEKQSLRTRVSFETAFHELGGHVVYLTKSDIDPGKRESIGDIARTLSTWSTLIVARLNSHSTLSELALCASVPVINALTDTEHPCQALADLMTIRECFGKKPVKIVYIGDGNNVANSLAITGSLLGYEVVLCTPPGYEASHLATTMPNVSTVYRPEEALKNAKVVYTDVWVSMGQESETDVKLSRFKEYCIDSEMMSKADRDAIFMHCLPARRELEVTSEVIDGHQSVVFQQAENRLHVQKALMKTLIDGVLT